MNRLKTLMLLAALTALLLTTLCPAFWPVLAGCLSLFAALVFLRVIRMIRPECSVSSLIQSFAVASVYEIARALALISRSTHITRIRHHFMSKASLSSKNV